VSKNDESTKTERTLNAIKLGAAEALAGGKTLTVLGTSYDAAGLDKATTDLLATYQTAREKRIDWNNAVSDRRAKEPDAKQFVRELKRTAGFILGETSVEYSKLGFKPRKPSTPLTPEQKQLRRERMLATRAARGTLGSRQKRSVKGDVKPPAPKP
jgi:hypothetical protein